MRSSPGVRQEVRAAGGVSRAGGPDLPAWKRLFGSLGPGMVMAATAIGASHVILSPVAGARFGYDLIWLVLFSHLFKYPAFEFAPRFAIASGTSLIRGYQQVPGPKNWALLVFLLTTTLQGLTILTGVIAVTASILAVTVGVLPFPVWIVLVGAVVVVLHKAGGYGTLQRLSKVFLAVLVGATVIAFFISPPPPSAITRLVVPAVPVGSILLISSIFGLMPTGINVSIWHSLWAVENLGQWRKKARDGRDLLRMGMIDLRVGYALSAAIAIMFMSLGATQLRPRGLTPDGINVALTLSRIYTEALGSWMFPVFMCAMFAAMFSTTYSVMDGFPRAFSTILKTMFPENAFLLRPGNPTYWMFMAVIFTFALVANTLLPNPVLMISFVGALSLVIAPVLYSLNYYCVTRLIEDPALRPSRATRAWALAGIFFMAVAAAVFLYTELYVKYLR